MRMPAEWAPHEATWLAWPHECSDWPGKFEPIPWIYGEIVRHLARVEKVRIITQDEGRVRKILQKCGVEMRNVEFFDVPTNRSWVRDFGPIKVQKARKNAFLNFRFNGWAKYDNYAFDADVPRAIAKKFG